MLLSTGEKVVVALGVSAGEGVTAKAEAALHLAFPIIEGLLETSLTYGKQVDYYNSVSLSVLHSYSTVLRLTNRFVDAATVVVKYALVTEDAISRDTGEILPEAAYSIDSINGLVSIFSKYLASGKYTFVVSYDYGADAPRPGKVPELPVWVEQAAISAAVMSMNVHPSIPGNKNNKTIAEVTTAIGGYLRMQLQAYYRPRLTVVFPDISEVVEV